MVKLFQPELSEAQKALLNTNGICIWPEIKSEATQVSEGQFLVYSKTHIAFMYEGFAYINEVYSEQRATVPDGTLRLEETRERCQHEAENWIANGKPLMIDGLPDEILYKRLDKYLINDFAEVVEDRSWVEKHISKALYGIKKDGDMSDRRLIDATRQLKSALQNVMWYVTEQLEHEKSFRYDAKAIYEAIERIKTERPDISKIEVVLGFNTFEDLKFYLRSEVFATAIVGKYAFGEAAIGDMATLTTGDVFVTLKGIPSVRQYVAFYHADANYRDVAVHGNLKELDIDKSQLVREPTKTSAD